MVNTPYNRGSFRRFVPTRRLPSVEDERIALDAAYEEGRALGERIAAEAAKADDETAALKEKIEQLEKDQLALREQLSRERTNRRHLVDGRND